MKFTVNDLDTRWVRFRISFTALGKVAVLFSSIQFTTLDAFETLRSIQKCHVSPFPAILIL